MNTSSYFPCSMLDRRAPKGCMFGPTEFKNERCWLYPNHKLKLNSTIIWLPKQKIHIGIASYIEAQANHDEEALKKLADLQIPLGMKFSADNDFSDTYVIDNSEVKPTKHKKPSISVMRVNFGGHYDEGGTFKPGDLVKITFRKWFIGRDENGAKQFLNGYERVS